MSPKKETYQIGANCNNCGKIYVNPKGMPYFIIPKGTTFGVFVRDTICLNCGAKGTMCRDFHFRHLINQL